MGSRLGVAVAAVALALGSCDDGPGADRGPADDPATAPSSTDAPATQFPATQSSSGATAAPRPEGSPGPSPSPTATASLDAAAPVVHTTVPLRIERRTQDAATADFVERAAAILADPRGWVRAGFAFEVVGPGQDAPYLLVLAEGDEVDELCRPYETHGRWSCQNGPVVALNADRWRSGTPQWTGTLEGYRAMLVNHEVGHLLHLHHPDPQCPGEGWPAPVMAQQSTELGACTPNPWPLPWEVELAARRAEPLAPPADHDTADHRPRPPRERQDTTS